MLGLEFRALGFEGLGCRVKAAGSGLKPFQGLQDLEFKLFFL